MHLLTLQGHNDYHQALNKLCRTLSVTQEINEQGTISRQALIEACHKLDDGDYVVLHIAAQNGGLVLRRKGDEFIFDAFEASAKSSEVLASTQALRWSFPGSSVAVPAARLLVSTVMRLVFPTLVPDTSDRTRTFLNL